MYVFGVPWEDGVLQPRGVEPCPMPNDRPCRVCGEDFADDDKGFVLVAYVLAFDGGKLEVTADMHVTAMHRECMFWRQEGHDAGYCHCAWPEMPTRELATLLWRSMCATWN